MTNPSPEAPSVELPVMERRSEEEGAHYKRSIYSLPVTVRVVLGAARPTIAELMKLSADSVLQLDKPIDAPVDLCVDDRVIARGELIETNPETGAIGVKLTEIVDTLEGPGGAINPS